ncbi:hypothetical protein GCM10025857_29200 [Alicyclobacillus contaminans]|uniref:AzlD domain-containing protein n=1 Tax=Alicyclobacillus contaminans TaxID=392016 RepID=UPI0003F86D11|nr:AzlD domain-containing protein [Alicyclobacillus contaminans]GMA51563.1 hypothetical protein GCM10025857_29200 [Alicyclobacillus contaminans]
MSTSTFVWLVVLVSIATYATRFPSLVLSRRVRVTPRLQQGLQFVPIGVFAAMVAPSVAQHALPGHTDIAFLVAVCVAFAVAFWTKNPLWPMLAGTVTAALLRLL